MRVIPHPDPAKPRLLLDECIPRSVFFSLQDHKFNAKWIGEECPSASDREVIELAKRERRILVTLDKEHFGAILMRNRLELTGMVLFRIEAKPIDLMKSIFIDFFEEYGSRLEGKITVYKENQIRQRSLEF